MKNKYQRMSKEEKKQIRDQYNKNKDNKSLINRLNRLIIIGPIGVVVSIVLIIIAIIEKAFFWEYLTAILLFICSIIFIVGSIKLRLKEYNKEALKSTKNK